MYSLGEAQAVSSPGSLPCFLISKAPRIPAIAALGIQQASLDTYTGTSLHCYFEPPWVLTANFLVPKSRVGQRGTVNRGLQLRLGASPEPGMN